MNEVCTIGLDLAKNVFQVHGADASGRVVIRKQLRRALPSCFQWVAVRQGTRFQAVISAA